MMRFRERIGAGLVIGDGGWGTMLVAGGLTPGSPPERWTFERPDAIADVARQYADAGAELITTNTFGASPLRLAQQGLEEQTEELNRGAVGIVREALGNAVLVSGSIGPTGHILAPLGDADRGEVAAGYGRQARALAEAGADLFCIETMTDLDEAVLAVRAARAAAPQVPIVATMTFDVTPRGAFTVMGVSVIAAAAALAAAGADVVGANCGSGVEEMIIVAREFLDATSLPVAIQPNAGLPRLAGGKLVYPTEPEEFAAAMAALAREGVRLIGGCCGTTPDHIRAVRRAIVARGLIVDR
jgi:methionine synthase I (cobalamin-dependent)